MAKSYPTRDLYQVVTDRILAKLEQGTAPWVQPYSRRAETGWPCNAVSNRPYRGVNLLLFLISQAEGWASPRFLTFNQAKQAGGYVKKGEHGRPIYLFKPMEKKDADTGETKKFLILREWTVFNVQQCDKLPDAIRFGRHADVTPKNKEQREEAADAFLRACGATIETAPGTPCYIPGLDKIRLPDWNDFHGQNQFYATAFHEYVHWTGHKSQLDRDLTGRFRSASYAAEELVAELGASFLAAEFGFDVVDNSAAYIQNWIKLLREDKKAIFTAASAAQKAVDFLRGKALEEDEETVPATAELEAA